MSHRIEQLNNLIKKELGQAILNEINIPVNTLLTVMKVETTKDVSQAKVWISILPEEKRKDTMNTLQKNRPRLQSILNKRLVLKRVPKIQFLLDTSEEKAERINKLLDQIINET